MQVQVRKQRLQVIGRESVCVCGFVLKKEDEVNLPVHSLTSASLLTVISERVKVKTGYNN